MRKSMCFGAMCLSATLFLALYGQSQQRPQGKESAHSQATTKDSITPLDVKMGLWQDTSTTTTEGMVGLPPGIAAQLTPEQRAKFEAAMSNGGNGTPRTITYKSCLRDKKELSEDPFSALKSHPEVECEEKSVKSTNTDVEVSGKCTAKEMDAKGDFHISFHALNSEHVMGTGQSNMTVNGRSMKSTMKYDSKWLGATCPAGVN
jgi:hypothetical protein